MKIAHFIYDDIDNPWLGGGGSSRLLEIYYRFPKNVEITVYTAAFPNSKREVIRKNIKFKRLGLDLSYFISRLSYSLCALFQTFSIDTDILIEDFSPYSPFLLPLIKKKNSIVVFQNIFGRHFFNARGLLGIFPWIFEKIYIKSSKSIMTSSYKLERLIRQSKKSVYNICPVPCGVDENCFRTIPNEGNYILYFGRLDIYQKGIDVLIMAYNLITEKLGDRKLIIAGAGKDEPKVKKLIADFGLEERVEIIGRVVGEKKYELLSNCLFLCMPSRFESWGIVAAEGMACGKPVIATKIEGLDEVVDEKTAILVPPEDPKALAQAMIRLARDRPLRQRLGRAARRKARGFDWQKRSDATLKFYKEHLGRLRTGQ